MSHVIAQRVTATLDAPEFVVFLIGARINRWWKVGSWLPVVRAMPRMIAELEANPELGLLGYEQAVGRTSIFVQYWRSSRHLLDYAKARDSAHLPAWREFNRRVGSNGDVGIWHETYIVKRGNYENIYNNMPPFGFGRVGKLEPVGKRRGASTESASDRLALDVTS
jgi:Domain of unknown function (DUF4188)